MELDYWIVTVFDIMVNYRKPLLPLKWDPNCQPTNVPVHTNKKVK